MIATALRILVADDVGVLRHALTVLLEARPGWQVVGEAATGGEAVDLAERFRPDVVILDIRMPEMDGLEAARRIRTRAPQTEILVFTMHASGEMLREALDAGARGYLLKSDAGRHLVTAVERVGQHKPFFSAGIFPEYAAAG